MSFFKMQFDKLLMALFVAGFCGLAFACLFVGKDAGVWDKLTAFALQAASGCLGCLLTLVTARRNSGPDLYPPDATSQTTTATVSTVSKTETPQIAGQ